MLMVVALIGTLAAVALPVMKDMTASIKLNDAARHGRTRDCRMRAQGGLDQPGHSACG